MQSDEEIGKMTQNTPVVISAAVELFIKSIVSKACQEAQARKASRISLSHLKRCICSTDQFDFLKDLVSDVPDPTEVPDSAESTKINKKTSLLPPDTNLGLAPIYNIPARPKPVVPPVLARPPPPPMPQFPIQQHTFSTHSQPLPPTYPPPLPNQHQVPYPYSFDYGTNPHYLPHTSAMSTFQAPWTYNPGPNGQHQP